MAKIRLYYNESGEILEIEHRPDEDYTSNNLRRQDTKTLITESDVLETESLPELHIVNNKVVKRGEV